MSEMPSWESVDDDRLLAAAGGDGAAFSALYRRYERPLLAFFVRRTGDAELAADLTAEVFAAVLLACGRYRPGPAPAHVWLFGIAQHKLSDSRRRGVVADAARRKLGMAPIELEDSDLTRIERDGGDALELLNSLPAEQREAVWARIVQERSYEAIAGELACSPAVVRKRVSRGLARLRDRIGHVGRSGVTGVV
jgi:RNA polymerase sigma factor (sigma-70 family)